MTKKSSPLPPDCILRKANYLDTFQLIKKQLKKRGMRKIRIIAIWSIVIFIIISILAFLDPLFFIFALLLSMIGISQAIEFFLGELIFTILSIPLYWVIEYKGCLVAYISRLKLNKNLSIINGLFVESDWRNKGLASCLINCLIQEASKPASLKAIYLVCKNNLVGFYARFGFVQITKKELPKSLFFWNLLDNNYSIMRYR